MDKTYLSRITLRKEIMRSHAATVLQAHPESIPAVNELYTFLFSTYLPQRFPRIFILSSTSLYNTATGSSIPLTPSSNPIETLSRIGENVDDEFLLLLKAEDGDGYVLKAFVTCFPNGFDTERKLGLRLREIHGPVPGYKEKLEKSMDRFFERLEVGRVVSRANVRVFSFLWIGRLYLKLKVLRRIFLLKARGRRAEPREREETSWASYKSEYCENTNLRV
jgi:hypothetical protein